MTKKPVRLFFAAWPPAELAQALHDWARAAVAGAAERPLPAENLHLTLAFLGSTPPERVSAAVGAARGVVVEPHTVKLDRAGRWPHGGVVWAAPEETPPALRALVARLETRLAAAGFALADRAFAPHVTLVRKAGLHDLPPLPPLEWPIAGFALARSTPAEGGSRYAILEQFAAREASNHQ